MGIFDKIIGKKSAQEEEKPEKKSEHGGSTPSAGAEYPKKAKEKPVAKKEKAAKSEKATKPKKEIKERKIEKKEENSAYSILREPVISEKSTEMGADNKYVFKVSPKAGKNEIKSAIEDYYGVQVVKVNTVRIRPKKRIHGRTVGYKKGFKKAIVTLRKGDTIGMTEGV
jgi:large subunit ribosomal protein L23